jgi:hypothetical protein
MKRSDSYITRLAGDRKNHLFGTIVGIHILELQKVEIFKMSKKKLLTMVIKIQNEKKIAFGCDFQV